jgi:hypothetical protein
MARKRRIAEEVDDEFDDELAAPPRARRKGRLLRRLGVLALLLAALVAAAPTLVGKLGLANWLLGQALPPGTVSAKCRDASFSWIGAQQVAGIEVADAAGQPLLSADSIVVDRSLIALAGDPQNAGRILLTRPIAYVEMRAQSSNLEEVLARFAEKTRAAGEAMSETAGASPTIAAIEVVDGVILGRDAKTGQEWRVERLTATAAPAAGGAWDVSGSGVLLLKPSTAPPEPAPAEGAPAAETPGRFKFQMQTGEAGVRRLEIVADRLPLVPLEPLLARSLPGARLGGVGSADLRATLGEGRAAGLATVAVAGKLDAADVQVTADALAGDAVELKQISLALDGSVQASAGGTRLSAKQLSLRSDWAQADFAGECDVAELATMTLRSLPTRDGSLTIRVDLPRLTAMLPRALSLRPGVRVDAGELEVTAKTAATDGARRWIVAAAIDGLSGTDGRRPIRWTQPVEAGFDLADSPTGPQLQKAMLSTPFAQVAAQADAAGAASGFAGTLSFNLGDAVRELGQLVDLSEWEQRGAGQGKFRFQGAGDALSLTAEMDLADVDVSRLGRPVWVDEKLHLDLAASGLRRGLAVERINTAKLSMRGPSDRLTAELLAPIVTGMPDQLWAIRVDGAGPLESWAGRLRPWTSALPERLAGDATLKAAVRARTGQVEASDVQLAVDRFEYGSGGVRIVEPRLEAVGDFSWNAAAAAIESRSLQASTTTVAAKAQGLSVRLSGGGPPALRGTVAYRADLARLAGWGLWDSTAGSLEPRGQMVGRLQLDSTAQSASGSFSATIEPFELVRRGAPAEQALAWSEPQLQVGAEAAYAVDADRLDLANLRVEGRTIKLTGGGSVDRLRGEGLVRTDLNVAYDAAEFARLLAAYLGPHVRIEGASQARLQLNGRLRPGGLTVAPASTGPPPTIAGAAPHWSRLWQGASEAGWSAANVYGLPIGPTRVVGALRDGALSFEPLAMAVGTGRLDVQPRVLFDPQPMRVQIAPGQIATRIGVTPEVSQQMLKFAAPILAGATQSEGEFSAVLDGFDMPASDPKQLRAAGRVTIHNLSIQPGPIIQDVARIVKQLESVGKGRPLEAVAGAPLRGVTMTDRTIDVQAVDGRIYHRNLEFLIDDVPVRSYGSVGFDETLALVIEVPVQQKWLGNRRGLEQLAGQTIQIPVKGTFSKPKVDEQAVAQLSGQLLQNAAQGVLGEELNKALDKLFKPR